MKAVVCPLCNGEGQRLVSNGPISEWGTPAVASGFEVKMCHGCNGKGWVEVREYSGYYVAPQQPGTLGYHTDPNNCPGCGGSRHLPALTGCPKGSHYGPETAGECETVTSWPHGSITYTG